MRLLIELSILVSAEGLPFFCFLSEFEQINHRNEAFYDRLMGPEAFVIIRISMEAPLDLKQADLFSLLLLAGLDHYVKVCKF